MNDVGNAILTYGPWVVTAAAAAAAALPAGGPVWWVVIRQVIDVAAMNIGNAKNAPPAPKA